MDKLRASINEIVWLSQLELAELFRTSKQNISKHIKAIFEDGELEESTTINYKLTVQKSDEAKLFLQRYKTKCILPFTIIQRAS